MSATHQNVKAMAKSLRDALAGRNVALSHSECLEIVARQLGFTDWNTLCAKRSAGAGLLAAPGELFCSFCGKSHREIRSLIEGGCARPRRPLAICSFICDECVTLCAQINADTDPAAGPVGFAA